MRLLIEQTQPFADEPLIAVTNFTWVGNSMGAQPGVLGRREWAGGLPQWTLIGAGDVRLYIVATAFKRPDEGTELIGRWPLAEVRLTQERYPRKAGPIPLGSWRAVRFEFPDREPAVLQPFGSGVEHLLEAHRSAHPPTVAPQLTEVALMTTSKGPFEPDVFFVLSYDDGSNRAIPMGDDDQLLAGLQRLPGFDNEAFIRAMAVSEDGISVLWRRSAGGEAPRP
ncbi:hypothetical protein [Mycolicibacterium sp. 120270]|uniref:hypothetical protein n=1 Tax=Mycolicibacterium sp. 120270 TaxID=3090600 RepID=UPI00299EC624|nr:hypothetical protein [Mycolicibacterium sp. 120270]MDX1886403.1 hypothetical protein [Mycolicibacterium sp. 120270]